MLADDLRMNLDSGQFVTIDKTKEDQLMQFVKMNKVFKENRLYDWSDSNYWIPNSEGNRAVSQFFALGNAINFCYWNLEGKNLIYCNGQKKGLSTFGARYMWRCLESAYDNDLDIFDAKILSSLDFARIKGIFRDDYGNNPMPHLGERLKNWNDLGFKLYEYWDGEFYNVIRESKNSLYKFVQYSKQFRAFDDPLCKLTMVNTLFLKGRGIAGFEEPTFPGIDYHLMEENLRIGVLVPHKKIADKIRNMELLRKKEARELRNACLRVFLDITEETNVSGEILDNKWWFNSRACKDDHPVCQIPEKAKECIFLDICDRNIEYRIPLEHTRYY
jgi:hypothetical protein